MKQKFFLWCLTGVAWGAAAQPVIMPELEQVVVTAPPTEEADALMPPALALSSEELRLKVSHSLGETLKNELGITSQSFGPGVGTPVIRGQAGSRVRVLANGLGGNDASTFSPDHASSVEPLLAERIEVLRGPATLLYGSGLTGGVVNVLDNRIPEYRPEKPVTGALEQRFDSVADETATTAKLEGGKHHVAYHVDGFFRDRGNVSIGGRAIDDHAARQTDPTLPQTLDNPLGFIANSDSQALSGSAGMSYVGDFGFAGLAANRLENNYGIAPDGSGGEITRINLKQSKYDFKSELKKPFALAETVRMKLSYTNYRHTEVPDGQEAAFFTNKTYDSRLEMAHQPIAGLRGTLGFQALSGDFAAIDKATGETIVPKTQTRNYSVFALEAFDLGNVGAKLGWRIEDTALTAQTASSFNYTPVSAAASLSWPISGQHSTTLALTRTQRAPQVQELLANGFHDATRSFELGNPSLSEETSYNLDLGYRFKADGLRAELDLFHNWAGGYIFQQRTGRMVDEAGADCPADTACFPVLASRQADATFMGYESKLVVPLMENRHGLLELTLFSDYTRGQFASGADVPRMPPLRFGGQLDYLKGDWSSNLRLTRGEAQTHPGEFDTATAGYVLLNLTSQYQITNSAGVEWLIFVKANNLLDENIRNSTSYLRNFAPEPGRGAEIGVRASF